MKKSSRLRNLKVAGPPLALILIGLGVYISVVKLLQPDPKTISAVPYPSSIDSTPSATPNASSSANKINPILTTVRPATAAEIEMWQQESDKGINIWRLDPISAAEQLAGSYGFLPGDQLNLVQESSNSLVDSKTATIMALHGGEAYLLTMVQPAKTGKNGIWIITSIEKQ